MSLGAVWRIHNGSSSAARKTPQRCVQAMKEGALQGASVCQRLPHLRQAILQKCSKRQGGDLGALVRLIEEVDFVLDSLLQEKDLVDGDGFRLRISYDLRDEEKRSQEEIQSM